MFEKMTFDEEDIFEFLDDLRDTGVVNMFEAAPYIQDTFDLGKKRARKLLAKWMRTYESRHPRQQEVSDV